MPEQQRRAIAVSCDMQQCVRACIRACVHACVCSSNGCALVHDQLSNQFNISQYTLCLSTYDVHGI